MLFFRFCQTAKVLKLQLPAAFVPVATPAQVLKAVTLGAPAGSGGGFFPNSKFFIIVP